MASRARLLYSTVTVFDRSRARLAKAAPTDPAAIVRVVGPEAMTDGMRSALNEAVAATAAVHLVETGEQATATHAAIRPWHGEVPVFVWPTDDGDPQYQKTRQRTMWGGARDGWIVVGNDARVSAASSGAEISPDEIVAYLPGSGPPIEHIAAGDRDRVLGTALARGLEGYARFLATRDRHPEDRSLSSLLEVRLRIGAGDEPAREVALSTPPAEPTDGVHIVGDDHWIWAEIRVVGRTRLPLRIAWITFSDDGTVAPLWPPPGAEPSFETGQVVNVGLDLQGAVRLPRRPDQSATMWTLRVIACTTADDAPLNAAGLAQASVQQLFAEVFGEARGAGTRAAPIPARRPVELPAWYAWDFRVAVKRDAR
jgi:hypothetical protein